MKRMLLYYFVLLFSIVLTGCSSDDEQGITPVIQPDNSRLEALGWHNTGEFIGKFNVLYYDGEQMISAGTMNTHEWLRFEFIPSSYVIPAIMRKEDLSYTLEEGQFWGGEEFGYLPKKSSVDATFTMYNMDLDQAGPWSLVEGTYNSEHVFFRATYGDSDIAYSADTDSWGGDIRITGIQILKYSRIDMKEIAKIELKEPYTLRFKSTGRVAGQ